MKKIIIFLSLISFHTYSATDYIGRGFSWYEDEIKAKKKERPKDSVSITVTPAPKKTATQELEEFHKKYNEVKNAAILYPTDENVKAFLVLKKESLERSRKFGDMTRKVTLQNPSLDYEATHPSEQLANHAYLAQQELKKIDVLNFYQQQGYGFFYLFSKNDIYGEQYSEQLQAFADQYKFDLLGISMDGSRFSGVRDVVDNNDKLQVEITPALLLVNPITKEIEPISYGTASNSQLIDNLYFISNGFETDK